ACPQMVFQQASEAARLRDRETAGFSAGTTRDVGDRFSAGQPKTGCGNSAVERPEVAGADPPKCQILIRCDANRAVAVRARKFREDAHLSAGEIAERHRHDGNRKTEVLLGLHVRRPPRGVLVAGNLDDRRHNRYDPGPSDWIRTDTRRDLTHLGSSFLAPVGAGFRSVWLDVARGRFPSETATTQLAVVLLTGAGP